MFKNLLMPSIVNKIFHENQEVFEAIKAKAEENISANVGMIKGIIDKRGIIEKSCSGGVLVAEKKYNGYYIYFKEKGSDVKQGGEIYIESAIEKAIKAFFYRMNSSNPELATPDEVLEQPVFSQTSNTDTTTSNIEETHEVENNDTPLANMLSGKNISFNASDIVDETLLTVKDRLLNNHSIRENVTGGVLVIDGFLEKDYVMYFKKEGSEVKCGEDVFKGEDIDKLIMAFLYRLTNNKPEKHSLIECDLPQGSRVINT